MKIKGASKRVGEIPKFWRKEVQSKVPNEMKEWIIQQYFSQQTMSIYCDASIHNSQSFIGVATSYVANGTVLVKQKRVYTPSELKPVPPMFAELTSIISALEQIEANIRHCSKAIIYSDVNDITRILGNDSLFKKSHHLQLVRNELKALYHEKLMTAGFDISIDYLPTRKKKFNPFHRSAHNGANRIIRNMI